MVSLWDPFFYHKVGRFPCSPLSHATIKPRLRNAAAKTSHRLSPRPHKHVHRSLGCIQGARLHGLRAWPSLPLGWTQGAHAVGRHGQRRPQARRRGNPGVPARPGWQPAGAWSSTSPSHMSGPPGDRGALHCRSNAIATQLGHVPFSPRALTSQVALAAAKAAALRINLNIDGCGVVASPVHAPSRALHLFPILLLHNIPFLRVD